MFSDAVRALCGLLACLALAVPCCASGDETVRCIVPYGGQFTAQQAERLAWAAAWLAGLDRAADALAGVDAVRLAGLNASQRRALAARLGLVDVTAASAPAERGAEGEAKAEAVLRTPDASELSRLLADIDGRDRREEVIAAMRRLSSEGLELAAKGHELRAGGADNPDQGSRRLRDPAHSSGLYPADELVAGRLDWLAGQLEAYALYLDVLKKGDDATPAETQAVLEHALALAPRAWPLRLAQAEMLLRQDRFRAALQILRELPLPPAGAAGKGGNDMGGVNGAEVGNGGLTGDEEGTALSLYARGLRLRALAQLRSGQPALAESDLDAALPLAPERGELWLARGAARQMREQFAAMCDDYYQACVWGLCQGLAAARARGQCLDGPDVPVEK